MMGINFAVRNEIICISFVPGIARVVTYKIISNNYECSCHGPL
jgi:hypothetical protein